MEGGIRLDIRILDGCTPDDLVEELRHNWNRPARCKMTQPDSYLSCDTKRLHYDRVDGRQCCEDAPIHHSGPSRRQSR